MKKLMLCSALSILFFNSYSQDTICTMVRLHEVVEFNYQTNEVASRYDNKGTAFIKVGYQEVLCLHLYDEKKRFRKVITTYSDGDIVTEVLKSKDNTYYSPLGVIKVEVRRPTILKI